MREEKKAHASVASLQLPISGSGLLCKYTRAGERLLGKPDIKFKGNRPLQSYMGGYEWMQRER